jgi:pSer/pThr/pTyr-binding forkhead associated (FHA) protein
MASPQLKVFFEGQLTGTYPLRPGHELIAGRGESCDVVLKPERGVSRQHFKIHMTEMGWELESLSRFGELYVNGTKVEKAILQSGASFSVPPYEFILEESNDRAQSDIPLPQVNAQTATFNNADEKTVIGSGSSAAILRLIDHRGQTLKNFTLLGLSWVAGRELNCAIFIDSTKISRRQFEIQKVEETYFIRDLATMNGTQVNGQVIAGDEWTTLSSSDVISIGDFSLVFEIRDSQFENRLSGVDPALRNPYASMGAGYGASEPLSMPSQDIPQNPGSGQAGQHQSGMMLFGKNISWLNPVRLGLLLLVFSAGVYYFVFDGAEDTKKIVRTQTPFEKLSPEKQQLVKQAYQLARDLYTTGKYELANQKILEIHGFIPYYEDSKELQKYIDNAIEIQRNRDKLLAQQEEERKRKEKVDKALADCALLLKDRDNVSIEKMEACIAPVLEFDPENPGFAALKNSVEIILTEKKMAVAKAEEYRRLVERREKLFVKAKATEKSGYLLSAITAYKVVVKSVLPDPNARIPISKRKIASIQSVISKKQNWYVSGAEKDYKAGNKKGAVAKLRKALRINPNNFYVENRIVKIIAELRKEMQPKYHDAILEESIGSVVEAKKKWMEIREASIIGEEYFEKARIKLRKYGEE